MACVYAMGVARKSEPLATPVFLRHAVHVCVCGLCVGTLGVALGMQSQAIRDCQLTASESPVAGQQARHARLGGHSGTQQTNKRYSSI